MLTRCVDKRRNLEIELRKVNNTIKLFQTVRVALEHAGKNRGFSDLYGKFLKLIYESMNAKYYNEARKREIKVGSKVRNEFVAIARQLWENGQVGGNLLPTIEEYLKKEPALEAIVRDPATTRLIGTFVGRGMEKVTVSELRDIYSLYKKIIAVGEKSREQRVARTKMYATGLSILMQKRKWYSRISNVGVNFDRLLQTIAADNPDNQLAKDILQMMRNERFDADELITETTLKVQDIIKRIYGKDFSKTSTKAFKRARAEGAKVSQTRYMNTEISLDNGKVTIPRGALMTFYRVRTANNFGVLIEYLENSPFFYNHSEMEKMRATNEYTEAGLNAIKRDIEQALSEQDKQYVDEMGTLMSDLYPHLAEAHYAMTGEPIGYHEDYIPTIKGDGQYIAIGTRVGKKSVASTVQTRKGGVFDRLVDFNEQFNHYFEVSIPYITHRQLPLIINEIISDTKTSEDYHINKLEMTKTDRATFVSKMSIYINPEKAYSIIFASNRFARLGRSLVVKIARAQLHPLASAVRTLGSILQGVSGWIDAEHRPLPQDFALAVLSSPEKKAKIIADNPALARRAEGGINIAEGIVSSTDMGKTASNLGVTVEAGYAMMNSAISYSDIWLNATIFEAWENRMKREGITITREMRANMAANMRNTQPVAALIDKQGLLSRGTNLTPDDNAVVSFFGALSRWTTILSSQQQQFFQQLLTDTPNAWKTGHKGNAFSIMFRVLAQTYVYNSLIRKRILFTDEEERGKDTWAMFGAIMEILTVSTLPISNIAWIIEGGGNWGYALERLTFGGAGGILKRHITDSVKLFARGEYGAGILRVTRVMSELYGHNIAKVFESAIRDVKEANSQDERNRILYALWNLVGLGIVN